MKRRKPPAVIGSLNVTLGPMTIAPVTPAEAYFGIAEALWPGVGLLAAAPSGSAVALTLVCGHTLECLLKAYLAKQGVSEADLRKPDVRHNLAELWRRAGACGLPTSPASPPWVDQLGGLHDHPFHLRYPMGFHGLVLPGREPMFSELQALLDVVRQAIR